MILEHDSPALKTLGWDSFFEDEFRKLERPELMPVRITNQQKFSYLASGEQGEVEVRLPGRMLREDVNDERPAVGDWVTVTPETTGNIVIVETILPRKNKLSRLSAGGRERKSGGKAQEQILASNVDIAFIVSALDSGRGLNLRRIERYLTLVWSSGVLPVVILNKIDLCENTESAIAEVEEIAPGVQVAGVSAIKNSGIETLKAELPRGQTGVFLGQSGVGKSSIINTLLGTERLKTGEIRQDDSAGRHTTTQRELFLIPNGGAVIDTPGLREIQLWTEEDSLNDSFADIQELAGNCRFRDCTHQSEPGCAVQQAVQEGILDFDRLNNYWKLQKEMRYLAARQDGRVRLEEKERWKNISKLSKRLFKDRQ